MAAIVTYGNGILVATDLFDENTNSWLFTYGEITGRCMYEI